MPPRWITLGIVLFWAATAAWFIYRETVEKPSQPPPFTIDRTDEIGVQIATWTVSMDGQKVGEARTRLGRNSKDSLYDSTCDYSSLDGFAARGLMVRQLSSQYRVTLRGELRGLSCSVTVTLAPPFGPRLSASLDYFFHDGFFGGRVERSHAAIVVSEGRYSGRVAVLNLLHPPHKIAGLSKGRRWRTGLLDPLATPKPQASSEGGVLEQTLQAEVTDAPLTWQLPDVPCWRVDFRDEAGDLRARVWVRQRDHLVLRQDAIFDGTVVKIERRLLG